MTSFSGQIKLTKKNVHREYHVSLEKAVRIRRLRPSAEQTAERNHVRELQEQFYFQDKIFSPNILMHQ